MNTKNQFNTIGKKAVRKRSASQRFCDVAKKATTPMKWKGTLNDEVFLIYHNLILHVSDAVLYPSASMSK